MKPNMASHAQQCKAKGWGVAGTAGYGSLSDRSNLFTKVPGQLHSEDSQTNKIMDLKICTFRSTENRKTEL